MNPTINETTFVRSIYFFDPDGILLEFAAWGPRELGEGDVRHQPATAADKERYLEMAKKAEAARAKAS